MGHMKRTFPILLLIFSQAIFVCVDYAIGESFAVWTNLTLLSLLLTFILVAFRILFELLLLRLSEYLAKGSLTLKSFVDGYSKSAYFPAILYIVGIAIQAIFIRASSDTFQLIILSSAQILYAFRIYYTTLRKKAERATKIVFCIYNVIYIGIQVNSLFTILN